MTSYPTQNMSPNAARMTIDLSLFDLNHLEHHHQQYSTTQETKSTTMSVQKNVIGAFMKKLRKTNAIKTTRNQDSPNRGSINHLTFDQIIQKQTENGLSIDVQRRQLSNKRRGKFQIYQDHHVLKDTSGTMDLSNSLSPNRKASIESRSNLNNQGSTSQTRASVVLPQLSELTPPLPYRGFKCFKE